MRAYFAQGRRELAVRSYERCPAALDELGLGISPSLERYADVHFEPLLAVRRSSPPDSGSAAATAGGAAARHRAVRRGGGPAGRPGLDPEALRDVVGSSLAAVIAEVEALGGP